MPTARYRYLPHTADIKFVAYGKDLRELIENSALALLNVMLDTRKIKRGKGKAKMIVINEKADIWENMIWYALQDMLTRIDEKSLCAFEFKVKSLSMEKGGIWMAGELRYRGADASCFLTEVKAVTPYDMKVRKTKGGYEMAVVLDV